MTRPEFKHLDRPDETRTFEKGHIELVELAGTTIGRVTSSRVGAGRSA